MVILRPYPINMSGYNHRKIVSIYIYNCDIPCIDGVSRFIGGASVVFWTTMGCGLMSVATTFS